MLCSPSQSHVTVVVRSCFLDSVLSASCHEDAIMHLKPLYSILKFYVCTCIVVFNGFE